jgi:hypothetical protein
VLICGVVSYYVYIERGGKNWDHDLISKDGVLTLTG